MEAWFTTLYAWILIGTALLGSGLMATGDMSVEVNGRDRTLWFRVLMICLFLSAGARGVADLLASA